MISSLDSRAAQRTQIEHKTIPCPSTGVVEGWGEITRQPVKCFIKLKLILIYEARPYISGKQ